MASECKLCALLGATTLNDSLDENQVTHADLHARQLELIDLNQKELTIDKLQTFPRNGSITRDGSGKLLKEKSKKSALFRLCRELIKIYGKDGSIKCSQCKNSIKSQRFTKSTVWSVVNHACIHLNKDLFSCRQCHLKFVSKRGVQHHLQNIHSLSGALANYIDMTDDHQSEIMDMLKLCFGKAPHKQLNVTPFGKQKRNIQGQAPLSKLSFNFIAKHQQGDRIQCNLCPTSILNKNRKDATRRLIDHVRWHLDKPIFTCRLCKYCASTEGTVSQHLKSSHSVAQSKQNFEDRSDAYTEQISSTLEDCFGEIKINAPPALSNEQKRIRRAQTSIRSRCGSKSLLAERQLRCSEFAQRFLRSGKLECRICHVHLVVVKAARANFVVVPMKHAFSHFNKLLFTCRRCSYSSTSKQVMGRHVRSKHGVPETNEFIDRTEDFHSDFMEMLSKCYDWDLEPERSEGSISNPIVNVRSNLSITSRMHGKELKAARHIHASELIRKHSTDGKMVCRVCSHSSSVLRGLSQLVFRHAMTHLDKRCWPYRCKMCPYFTVARATALSHLKHAHKDKDADKFEDLSDKYHTEIMEILSKCYDWSVEPEVS